MSDGHIFASPHFPQVLPPLPTVQEHHPGSLSVMECSEYNHKVSAQMEGVLHQNRAANDIHQQTQVISKGTI